MKNRMIGLRLSGPELERLERLALREGIERCQLLRQLLARADQLLPRPNA